VLRSIQLVTLQPAVILAVAVLSNGAVEKEVVELDDGIDEARIGAANAALSGQLVGRALSDLPPLQSTGDTDVDRLARLTRDAFATHPPEAEPLYVGGASRIAAEHQSFATVESAARLIEMLEHQVVVVSLVRDLLDQGVTVRIGSENELEELRDCAIVLAPYEGEGEVAGTVGVLGPTRMDYRQALAAVAAVSQQLGRLLS
jgi:heat-inducible transcriptional repressor